MYIFWILHQTTTASQSWWCRPRLYIFWFLHQTTTALVLSAAGAKLYIFWFLHQTTTTVTTPFFVGWLYIFWFLHQTTTYRLSAKLSFCCISFDSYIKPQRFKYKRNICNVVYLLIPTSNHNSTTPIDISDVVVYLLIPTSNHNL